MGSNPPCCTRIDNPGIRVDVQGEYVGMPVHNESRGRVSCAQTGVIVLRVPNTVPVFHRDGSSGHGKTKRLRQLLLYDSLRQWRIRKMLVVVASNGVDGSTRSPQSLEHVSRTDISRVNDYRATRDNRFNRGVQLTMGV